MASLTLAIPEGLREEMKRHPEINWSEVARQAIRSKAELLEKMNRLLSVGGLDTAEVPAISREIKKRVWDKRRK